MHWLGYWGEVTEEKKVRQCINCFLFWNITVTEDQNLVVWLILIVSIAFYILDLFFIYLQVIGSITLWATSLLTCISCFIYSLI